MIPLILVCGFLGSGKTTLLRHWARTASDRRIVYVVNEFSSRDVDSELLRQDAPDVVPLPGGSIFCKCLAADFHRTMRALAEGEWDAIVAEASGVADPSSTRTLLAETGLDRRIQLAEVLCVVDPATFPKLRSTLPAIVRQVASADRIVVGKTDLHPQEAVSAVADELRRINPSAEILLAERGRVPLPDAARYPTQRLDAPLPEHPDEALVRFEARLLGPTSLDSLRRELGQIPGLLRLKGFFDNGAGLRTVDFDGERWTEQEAPPGVAPSLAAIGLRESGDELRRALARVIQNAREP